jgi:signal peptidase II
MSELIEEPTLSENMDQPDPVITPPEPFTLAGFFRRWWVLLVVLSSVLTLDQIVKTLVVIGLKVGQSWVPVPAIGEYIKITRSFNRGAAFGILPEAGDLFLVLALVTIALFVINYPRLPANAWMSRLSIGLISGGALSNALDRLRFEHVVDYVHVQLTPTFANISNLADHAITVGVILLMIDQWRTEEKGEDTAPADSESNPDPVDIQQASMEESVT